MTAIDLAGLIAFLWFLTFFAWLFLEYRRRTIAQRNAAKAAKARQQ